MGLEPIEKLVSKTNTFTNFVTRALLGFPEDKPRLSTSLRTSGRRLLGPPRRGERGPPGESRRVRRCREVWKLLLARNQT